jgi:hypothetical protein
MEKDFYNTIFPTRSEVELLDKNDVTYMLNRIIELYDAPENYKDCKAYYEVNIKNIVALLNKSIYKEPEYADSGWKTYDAPGVCAFCGKIQCTGCVK